MNCGVGHRLGSDPALLWLQCRPATTAPIRTLAWEPPYAIGAALKETKYLWAYYLFDNMPSTKTGISSVTRFITRFI